MVPLLYLATQPTHRSFNVKLNLFMDAVMRRRLFSLLMLGFLVLPAAASDDWPQFRGPSGQGHSDAIGLPLTWSETENVTWKVPILGSGCSSPVILGDQIWLTTAVEDSATPEETKRRLHGVPDAGGLELAARVTVSAICVDRTTGKANKIVQLLQIERPCPVHKLHGYASPTPVIESGLLYCDFGDLGTVCMNTTSGKILWKRRLEIDHHVGPGSSPLVVDNLLVLVRDGCQQQYITALDKRSGKTVWKTNRPPKDTTAAIYKKAFSTPLLVETDGGRQLVVPGAQWGVAYKPETGNPIWRVNYGRTFSIVPRPVFAHGLVYVCTGDPGPQLWAIRPDGRGEVTDTHAQWRYRRGVPVQASPLVVHDEIYIISDAGVATCLDAKTGHVHWQERVSGNYSASPVYADGRIYFPSREGKTTVLKPGREFIKLAENVLDGRLMASPALVDSAMFLRSDTHLYRIEKRP